MPLILGCIADDITGATDIALMLSRNGMNVVQTLGLPNTELMGDPDAVVVALKTRSLSPTLAVKQSIEALSWLKKQGANKFFFKYCSTFDSTVEGNIGPVAQALLSELQSDFTVVCPAFPVNGRTVYNGHLFVGESLLSESSMRDHPITPMRDSNLVRVMQAQVDSEAKVGLVNIRTVAQGASAINKQFEELRKKGVRFAVVDAFTDQHLIDLAHAAKDLPLLTGGSALAMGLADAYTSAGLLLNKATAPDYPSLSGPAVILAGSCSETTLKQIESAAARYPVITIDPQALVDKTISEDAIFDEALSELENGPVIISSSAKPDAIQKIQASVGQAQASHLLESTFASLATRLAAAGINKFIVAGGETSGAVATALSVSQIGIVSEIDAGVPWVMSLGKQTLMMTFKSGNFGTADFFIKAVETAQ